MKKERLFELAVSLVAANISAGQFNDGMNFNTIVYDQTQLAFDQLEKLWEEISGDADEGNSGGTEEDGGIKH